MGNEISAESWTPSQRIVQAGSAKYLLEDHQGDRAIVWEIWESNAYRYHPKPNDVVLDVGGHKGVFSVWAALHGAMVYSYEPCLASYETLLLNIHMNHVEHLVRPRNMAVWVEACRLPLYHWPGDAGGNSLLENTRQDAEDVLCTTLEDAMLNVRWCDFLKCDIEGGEMQVLGFAPDSVLERIGSISAEIHSPALDPGGRENPVKFTAYNEQDFNRIINNLGKHFAVEVLRANNGDPNYIYATRRDTK
jgi:FkbM family methyltransferase